MRTLKILAFAQTGLLVLLLSGIVRLDEREIGAVPAKQDTLASGPFAKSVASSNAAIAHYPDEDRLRKIIREELSAQLDLLQVSNQHIDKNVAPDSINEPERDNRREQVFQKLEYYSSVGSISDMEMQQLQTDIAKLDAVSRKEVLSQLSRALNSGQLEGRL